MREGPRRTSADVRICATSLVVFFTHSQHKTYLRRISKMPQIEEILFTHLERANGGAAISLQMMNSANLIDPKK
jgi:hypothetical protein